MNLQSYIDVSVNSLARALELRNIYLPLNFADSLFNGGSVSPDIVHVVERIEEADLDEAFCANMALNIIRDIHRQWIRYNGAAFHLYPNMRYRFMPMPLIGINATLRYYELLQPFLSLLGIASSETELRKQYDSIQDTFVIYGVSLFLDGFVEKLLADYGVPATKGEVAEIVNQIATHSPTLISRKGFGD